MVVVVVLWRCFLFIKEVVGCWWAFVMEMVRMVSKCILLVVMVVKVVAVIHIYMYIPLRWLIVEVVKVFLYDKCRFNRVLVV